MCILLHTMGNGADQQFPADPRAWRHAVKLSPTLSQHIFAKADELPELGGKQGV